MYSVCCWHIHVHVWLCRGSVLSWCKCYFLLFRTRYHTLPYPKTKGNKSKPRMKLNYNMHYDVSLATHFSSFENWELSLKWPFFAKDSRLEAFNVWDVKVVWCRNGMYKSKRKYWKKEFSEKRQHTDSPSRFSTGWGINVSRSLGRPVFIPEEFNWDVKAVCYVRLNDALNRRR